MSNRHKTEARTIHPRALADMGEKGCITALGVARDLRSGVIPPNEYNQRRLCGTACCILGHIRARNPHFGKKWFQSKGLLNLFWDSHPSDPILAADAIERYIYAGSQDPWHLPDDAP